MKYREWRNWVRSKPWVLRWFVYLVLLRPVIDNLYYLKHISPFLSPLNIVGVLTPVLTLLAFNYYRPSFSSSFDKHYRTWSVMVLFSTVFVLFSGKVSLDLLASAIKFIIPVVLFFFLRLFIRGQQDLDGLIQTFLYSLAIVLGIFFYEIAFGPIRITESRGLTRIQGNFGDVFNYGLYLCFGLVFIAYREMRQGRFRMETKVLVRLGVSLAIGVMVLMNINHAASLIVFSFILFLYAYYQSRRNLIAVFVFMLLGLIFVQTLGQRLLEESINPLFERDLMALSGEINEEQLFHGRYGRWQYFWDYYTRQPIPGQLLGVPVFNLHDPLFLTTGSGSHNDYIRIGMFTGIFGLVLYVTFHLRLLIRTRNIPYPDRFLVTSVLALLGLYSITLTPTLYAPVLYMTYATFAYIIITYFNPRKRKRWQPRKERNIGRGTRG